MLQLNWANIAAVDWQLTIAQIDMIDDNCPVSLTKQVYFYVCHLGSVQQPFVAQRKQCSCRFVVLVFFCCVAVWPLGACVLGMSSERLRQLMIFPQILFGIADVRTKITAFFHICVLCFCHYFPHLFVCYFFFFFFTATH